MIGSVPASADPHAAAAAFVLPGAPVKVVPHRGGHIHRSWVVACDAGPSRYLLQALNTAIFPDPGPVMANMVRVTEHLRAVGEPTLTVIGTKDGGTWSATSDGRPWRMTAFVEGATSRAALASPAEAAVVGEAFGRFSTALTTLPGPPLAETIQGFHDIGRAWRRFEATVADDPVDRVRGAGPEIDSLHRFCWLAEAWLAAATEVAERIAHNDAKVDNVLLDDRTGERRAVVDLDTVMPGTVLADLGDLVRSASSRAAEDERDLDLVRVDHGLFEGVVRGFTSGAGAGLSDAELGLAVRAGQAITFEQSVRFLADHVAGDRYYPAARPAHNLGRARAQLRLLTQMVDEEDRLRATVAGIAERRGR